MIVALEEARLALVNMRADLKELGEQLKIEQARATVEELEQQTADPDFWGNTEKSSKVLQTIKQHKDKIESYEALCMRLEDTIVLAEMAIDENDESCVEEVQSELAEITSIAEKKRTEVLLSGEYDRNNAIISFHPGAGASTPI